MMDELIIFFKDMYGVLPFCELKSLLSSLLITSEHATSLSTIRTSSGLNTLAHCHWTFHAK